MIHPVTRIWNRYEINLGAKINRKHSIHLVFVSLEMTNCNNYNDGEVGTDFLDNSDNLVNLEQAFF